MWNWDLDYYDDPVSLDGSVNTYVVICSGVQRRKEKASELVVVPSRSVGQRTALLPFLTGVHTDHCVETRNSHGN